MILADKIALSENAAMGIGLVVLMSLVVCAVSLFLLCGSKTRKFEHLEHDNLDTEYGVAGMVRDRMERFEPTRTRGLILGVVLCVASCIPLFAAMASGSEFLMAVGVCAILAMVALGHHLGVLARVRRAVRHPRADHEVEDQAESIRI